MSQPTRSIPTLKRFVPVLGCTLGLSLLVGCAAGSGTENFPESQEPLDTLPPDTFAAVRIPPDEGDMNGLTFFAAAPDTTVTIPLAGATELPITGEATLQETDEGQTEIAVSVQDASPEMMLAAVLVAGSCAEPGEPLLVLEPVMVDSDGYGSTGAQVEGPLELLTLSPVAVQVFPAGDEPAEALLCGDWMPSEDVGEVGTEPGA